MSDERAREIAGKLSGPQKQAILRTPDDQAWRTAKEIGCGGNTLASLMFFYGNGFQIDGLAYQLMQRDYMDGPLRYIYRLTSLGGAVRRILEETNNAQG